MGRGRLRLLAPVLVISSMAGAAGLASGALVSGAGATDPQAQLRALRSQVDATGARYFDALATSRRLDAELETLRAQARSVDDHLRANRSDAVAQAAAATVKRVHQELGGKAPNLVLEGADLASVLPPTQEKVGPFFSTAVSVFRSAPRETVQWLVLLVRHISVV